MIPMNFKKEKEYLIELQDGKILRLICTKITKDTSGNVINCAFKESDNSSNYIFSINEIGTFISIKEPIDNTEFFQMYVNWMNFFREGAHQDLEYAEQLRLKIINTLQERSHVMYGSGAFVEYDLKLLNYLIGNKK